MKRRVLGALSMVALSGRANVGQQMLRGAADIVLDSRAVYWMNASGVFRAAK